MSKGTTRNVAQAVAARLAELGTRQVFGYPGGETLDLLEAFRAAGLQFVLTHHEATAAFAAAATGELTGRPGICISTLGPGATNLLSGVAAALLERAPMLAFTAQLPRARHDTTPHQGIDIHRLYAPVTKASLRLEPGDALRTLEKAVRLATASRPGPVHIEVPSDVPGQPCVDRVGEQFFRGNLPLAHAGAAPASAVQTAERLIIAAQRPVALVGAGALAAGQAAVTGLVAAAGLPTVVTPKAKGLVSERHPLFAGVIEMLGKREIVDWLGRADLFVYIGFDPVELDMLWEFDAPGVLIDSVPDTDAYYRVDVQLTGSVGATLAALAASEAGPDGDESLRGERDRAWGAEAAAECRAAVAAVLGAAPAAGLLAPRTVVEAVRAAADHPDALATTDVGAHKMAAGQLWRCEHAGCFLMSNGQSSMGYGLPAAMAAKLLSPARQVVALIGDGGLQMYLGELATLARLRLSLPVVVFVDQQLTLIAMGQERRGYPRSGVGFAVPDYAPLAASLGGYGKTVGSADELRAEVGAAWSRGTFSLLAVPVDEQLYRV